MSDNCYRFSIRDDTSFRCEGNSDGGSACVHSMIPDLPIIELESVSNNELNLKVTPRDLAKYMTEQDPTRPVSDESIESFKGTMPNWSAASPFTFLAYNTYDANGKSLFVMNTFELYGSGYGNDLTVMLLNLDTGSNVGLHIIGGMDGYFSTTTE